jgi:hypothetical protein
MTIQATPTLQFPAKPMASDGSMQNPISIARNHRRVGNQPESCLTPHHPSRLVLANDETANDQRRVSGGADRDRTGGLLVANQALSQLSYSPTIKWWAWVELNYRPHPYQGCALAN